jgi:hypothetical protein
MQIGVFFDPTTEADAAREAITQLEQAFAAPAAVSAPQPAADGPAEASVSAASQAAADAVTLHQETDPHNRSRKLLEALTTEPRTFGDLAPQLPPNDDGSTLDNAQVRAVYRNIKRTEGRLIKEGTISGPVVQTDFDRYDADGAGRYFLNGPALAALDRLLGR